MVSTLTSYNRLARFFIIFATLLLSTTHAQAKPVTLAVKDALTPHSEEVDYRVEWMGLTLGRAKLLWIENKDRYNARITITTSGAARLFNQQTRILETRGTVQRKAGHTTYIPTTYRNAVDYKKKKREMMVRFDKNGIESSYEVTPPDNRRWRPEVPDAQRNDAYDIMTSAMLVYDNALAGKEKLDFTVFDARRLSGIHYMRQANAQGMQYVGTRSADAGYTDKELKEDKEEEIPVTVVYEDKTSRFVTKVFAKTPLGMVQAVREHHRVPLSPKSTKP